LITGGEKVGKAYPDVTFGVVEVWIVKMGSSVSLGWGVAIDSSSVGIVTDM
jgi:hypothetical protein